MSRNPPNRPAVVLLLVAGLACTAPREGALNEEVMRDNVRGTAYLGQLNWTEAEAAFSRALARHRADPVLLTNLAIAQLHQGRLDDAEAQLERAAALDANFAPAHYNLGLIANRRGDYPEAAQHFTIVARLDPEDLFTQYYLGSSLARSGREDEALSAFRAALRLDPNNVSTLYGLGRLLLQRGEEDEGLRLVERSQEIRARSGLDSAVGTEYGEQGPYGMGIDYPGDAMAAPAPPPVSFTVVERVAAAAGDPPAWTLWRGDRDAPAQFVIARDGSVQAAFEDATVFDTPPGAHIVGLTAGDVDDDGTVELVIVSRVRDGARLTAGIAGGAVIDQVDEASAERAALTLFDRDHDGDLDLIWCAGAGCRIATHGSSTAFDGRPSEAHGFDGAADAVAFSDFDNDRDVDLLLAGPRGLRLLSNQRDGTFTDHELLAQAREFAVADVNKDGAMDLVLGGGTGLRLARNMGRELAAPEPIGGVEGVTTRPVVLDYDNDGFLDVAVGTSSGPRLVRNEGAASWSTIELPGSATTRPLAAYDADGDGDRDIVQWDSAGELQLLRNDGGNANNSLTIESRGLSDNHYGIGTKVEVLAGALRQKFEVVDPLPLQVGLGRRESVQSIRYLWPSGVLQDELDVAADSTAAISQLDRKGSSCPLLYAWSGGDWRFVTDFLGGAAVGYLLAPGIYNTPDTDEYVPIPFDLVPGEDGLLRLRANNQLEEVLWFDRMQLLAVDHPSGTWVVPDERLMPAPPFPEFRLFASSDVRPVRGARSVEAGLDVTQTLRAIDRRYVDDFALLPPKGYAAMHTLELDLGPWPAGARAVLLLHGWIDYADSSSNVQAAQAGLSLVAPRLQVSDGRAGWVERPGVLGFPAGLPKTLAVEIGELFPSNDHRVRIVTNMRIYWDRALVMVGGEAVHLGVTRIDPAAAELRYGGFPRETSPDGRLPNEYDPSAVEASRPWKAHVGSYTAFGDVTALVASTDDRFVTTRSGDELELAFEPPAPPAAGFVRSWLLYADGFGKDMDPNSAAPTHVGPIPFHGMPHYPYDDAAAPPRALETGPARRVLPSGAGWPGAPARPW